MADTKISSLTQVVNIQDSDEFAVNQSFVSKKVTAAQVKQDLTRVVASFSADEVIQFDDIVLLESAPEGNYRVSAIVQYAAQTDGAFTVISVKYFKNTSELNKRFLAQGSSLDAGIPRDYFQDTVGPVTQGDEGHFVFFHDGTGDISISNGAGQAENTGFYDISVILERLPDANPTEYHGLVVTITGTGDVSYSPDSMSQLFLPTIDSGVYEDGTVVQLTPSGGTFIDWTGDVPAGDETDNPLNLTMDQARQVSANFVAD